MKHFKIIALFFLLNPFHLNAMEVDQKTQELRAKMDAIALTAQSTRKKLTLFKNCSFPQLIIELPTDIDAIIVDKALFTTDLPTAAQTIHRLTHLCKSMHAFIDNKENTLAIIKGLSLAFKYSNEHVAVILPIPTARNRLVIQKGFESVCRSNRYTRISDQSSRAFKENAIDINFTYGDYSETQLQIAANPSQYITDRKPLIQDLDISAKQTNS